MSNIKLSVIVPVYNAEKYLRQCLDSILAQTFRDMEIICIDDGSSDGSYRILQEYAGKDARINLIHKENAGLVSVRKLGAKMAKGKYIGFVDSDDWIDPEMYERLCYEAERTDADLVSSNYYQEGAYTNVSKDTIAPGFYDEDRMDLLREHTILNLKKHDKGLNASVCTKIFRTNVFSEIISYIPDAIRLSEDKVTSLTFLLECRRVFVLDEAYYHYRINHESMVHAYDPEYLLNYHHVYSYLRGLYSHKNFTESMRTQAELYIVQFLIKGINIQMGFSFRNLMWIDPAWLDHEALGRDIAVYGEGDLGRTYEKQIRTRKDKEFCGYMSEGRAPSKADSIVIAIKNEKVAMDAKETLVKAGIPKEMIFWFRQEEIFWKYVDAMGLNDSDGK